MSIYIANMGYEAEVVCTEQYRCELELGECDNGEYTAVQEDDY